nr:glycoside hydrolase, family 63 [Tanacetum cinerariifolium]
MEENVPVSITPKTPYKADLAFVTRTDIADARVEEHVDSLI